jgi:AcrR family transcriptional regulator
MPKLAPEAQRARRENILDAAERCFMAKGFHTATMSDICREAGVSPGALYIYFTSKEALIAGLCQREKDRVTKDLGQLTDASDFLAALRSLAEHYCCQEPREKLRLHLEIAAEAGRNGAIAATVRSTNRDIRGSLAELLAREKAKGRIDPRFPIDVIVRAMSALGDGLFFHRALETDFDPQPILPAMMAMIEALLAPSPEGPAKSPKRKPVRA